MCPTLYNRTIAPSEQLITTEAMRYILLVVVFALPLTLFVDAAHAQCPEPNMRGVKTVENFFTEDFYAERREQFDISASVDSIRVLNEEQDLEVCNHFSSVFDTCDESGYRKYHFYKAENYYFSLLLVRPRTEWPNPEALLSAPREVGLVHNADLEAIHVFVL